MDTTSIIPKVKKIGHTTVPCKGYCFFFFFFFCFKMSAIATAY